MMCYKDRTFCPFYKICAKGSRCHSALTEQVHKDAIKWWGTDEPPIMQYVSPLEVCYVPKTV